jgi:hypothetical protein
VAKKPGPRLSAQCSSQNPDYSNVAMIYDTSRAGMHLWVV